MMTLKLAWRSLLRHKRRSLITGVAISLSLALILFSVGISADSHERLADQGVRMGSGHVVVQAKGYQLEGTLDRVVEQTQSVVKTAKALPHVRAVAVRVRAEGLISAAEHSVGIAVSGVDPIAETAASDLPKKLVAGSYLRARDQMPFSNTPADIVLGTKLARKLEVNVGDRVVLTVSPRKRPDRAQSSTKDSGDGRRGQTRSAAFIVRGLLETGVATLDGFYAEVPISAARTLYELSPGQSSQVALILSTQYQSGQTAQALAVRLSRADLEVLPWQRAMRELYDALVLDDGSFYVMIGIIFLLVAIGIFNTVLMSVVERTRELGLMMAIGTSRRRLFGLVLGEALLLALLATTIGVALGLAFHFYIASTGIDLAQFAGEVEMGGVPLAGTIYSKLSLGVVLSWAASIIALVVVSSIYPAWRATRLLPVQAMRHV
jgi:ABC-type lipoprotein release transport system permease subunit